MFIERQIFEGGPELFNLFISPEEVDISSASVELSTVDNTGATIILDSIDC